MIGDHHTDLLAAKNAGIKCALVETGVGDSQELVDFFNRS
jgi:phosphoglycolate phosphatase-like HAD superfamily hydrolase